MKPWIMALVSGRRPQLVTVTRTSNDTLTLPAGVSTVTVSGYGAPGTPGSPGSEGWTAEYTTVYDLRAGGQESNASSGSGTGPIPGPSGCTYTSTPDSAVYIGFTSCAFYTSTTTGETPPTTGASGSAFGVNFPGGAGGPATPVGPISGISVAPGPYPITVPAGGSITISYYV